MRFVLFLALILATLPSTVLAEVAFDTELRCVYTDAKGKTAFNGQCFAAYNELGRCRRTDVVRERYVVMFTGQSKIAVDLYCDKTASVNGIAGSYKMPHARDGKAILIQTVEGEVFVFTKMNQPLSNRTFKGRLCTEDCSGHEAGYSWAERNGIEDASDCEGGKSASFIEGCQAYVEENKG